MNEFMNEENNNETEGTEPINEEQATNAAPAAGEPEMPNTPPEQVYNRINYTPVNPIGDYKPMN